MRVVSDNNLRNCVALDLTNTRGMQIDQRASNNGEKIIQNNIMAHRRPVAASISLNRGSSTRSGVGTSILPLTSSSLFNKPCSPTTCVGRLFGDDGEEGNFSGASLIGGDEGLELGIEGAAGISADSLLP